MGWRAEAMAVAGEVGGGVEEAERALEVDPSSDVALRSLKRALAKLGRKDEFLRRLDVILEKDARNNGALEERYEALTEAGRYEEALKDVERLLECPMETEERARMKNEEGLLLSYLGRLEGAIAAYEDSLREVPEDLAAMYNVAIARARLNGAVAARESIEAATRKCSEMKGSADGQGVGVYGLSGLAAVVGKRTEALGLLGEAIQLRAGAARWAQRDIAWAELREDAGFVG
jgi:tetratricopeptide (TPR) repeat protein